MKSYMKGVVSIGYRTVRAMCVFTGLGVTACSSVSGIDPSTVSPISNNDTYATLGYLWAGARSAIQSKREPSTDAFSLPLTYALPCTRGGQGAYQGTLAGTKSGGTGSATLSLGAAIAACQFDDNVRITTISAPVLTVSGTVAVVNDAWGAVSIHMVATTVTVNGVACPGGIDVILTGTSPSAQLVSTGTACGRVGAVTLP
ncbi:MAG: hypothetical protein ABI625_26425 [bacterium]